MLTADPNAPAPGRLRSRRGTVQTLISVRKTGSRPPFFCFCAGHGDMLAIAQLGKLLDADQPFYCLQAPLPGAADLVRPDLLDWLLDDYEARVRAVAPSGPIVLGGNSCGGLIAFALAQRLASRGETPPPVVLLDTPFRITRPNYWAHRALAWITDRTAPKEAPGVPRHLRFARAMFTDDGLDVHVRATRRLQARSYPGRIALYMAAWRHLAGTLAGGYIGRRRWEEVAGGGFALEVVPGHHISFLREPHVRGLAARLDHYLGALANEAA